MDLNIREFPEELAKQLKLMAIEQERTLREMVIEACTQFSQPEKKGSRTATGYDQMVRQVTKRRKSVLTELPAGSATTGMEEQGTVAEREAQLDADMAAFKERLGQTYHSETCKCLMCQFKRGEIK